MIRPRATSLQVSASLRARGAEGSPADHLGLTGVVLDDVRLVYVPIPRAATTSILSALADLAGLDAERHLNSGKLEATRSATIHDGSLWPSVSRLGRRSQSECEAILTSDEWFRFTVVREPLRRVWSAWVTKVLLRDPRFLASFEEHLFPPRPTSATDVLESFRAFVCSLQLRPEFGDPHWSCQADLADAARMRYDYVGRVERLDELTSTLTAYLRDRGKAFGPLQHGNATVLPFSPGLFDRDAYDACLAWTDRDRRVFGYEALRYVDGGPDATWFATVEAALPSVRAIIERHERMLDLWRLHGAVRPRQVRPRWASRNVFRRRKARLLVRAVAIASLFTMAYVLPSSVHHL